MKDIRSYIAKRRSELRAGLTTIAVTLNTALEDVDVLGDVKGRNLSITHVNGKPIEDGGAGVDVYGEQNVVDNVLVIDDAGVVTLVDGLLTITPETGYTGPIAFRYTVSDGKQVREGFVVGSVT